MSLSVAFLFGKGLLIGLSVAAPVGPIGVLCINRSLTDGPRAGFVTGLGAAVADGVYGAVAAFGLAAVSLFLLDHQDLVRGLGGAGLLALGLHMALKAPTARAAAQDFRGLLRAFASCFLLTLANPATILSFVAVFAALGLADRPGDLTAALVMVVGVFLGSALWWLGLAGLVGRLRHRLSPAAVVWINRTSGAVLCLFGLVALGSLVIPSLTG